MQNPTYHHANLLDGMWRNPSAKLVKVADDVLRSGASPYNLQITMVGIECNSKHTYLIFGA